MSRILHPYPHIQTGYARTSIDSEYPELWKDLICAYPFGMQGIGQTAYDFSGYKQHGAFTNGPVWKPGKFGNAIEFDGSDDYLHFTPFKSRTYTDFTIMCWCKTNRSTNSGFDDQRIFGLGNGTGDTHRIFFGTSDDSGEIDHLKLNLDAGPATSFSTIHGNSDVVDQEWHHVAVTRSGTSITFWVDGVNDGGGTSFSNSITPDADYIYAGDEPGNTEQMDGLLDDIRMYTRVLTPEEIRFNRDVAYAPWVRRRRIHAAAFDPPSAFDINAEPGSYAITGIDAEFGIGVNAALGSYAQTGVDAEFGIGADASPGVYAQTGVSAELLAGRLINSEPGSYGLTGVLAQFGIAFDHEPGAHSLTGVAAQFSVAFNHETGAYTLTGIDAELGTLELILDPGTYSLTGVAAQFGVGFNHAPGSYSLTGAAAETLAGYLENMAAGSYLLSGIPSQSGIAFNHAPGSYALSGVAASFGLGLNHAPGVYVITGIAAELGSVFLNAEPGSYLVIGVDVTPGFPQTLSPGAFALSGVSSSFGIGIQQGQGVYALTGAPVMYSIRFNSEPGSYLVTGIDLSFLSAYLAQLSPGSYTLTGVDAQMVLSILGIPNFIRLQNLTGSASEIVIVKAEQ